MAIMGGSCLAPIPVPVEMFRLFVTRPAAVTGYRSVAAADSASNRCVTSSAVIRNTRASFGKRRGAGRALPRSQLQIATWVTPSFVAKAL